ncbi:MAG: hypothetical protein LBT91_01395, partial [Bifidobacteriaceae bacterium]|nr:hypothetical protein [Bifidobacteriaceae bacterium]
MLKQSQISEICRQLGIKPNKKLGQNFMIDKGTVEKIISLAGFNSLSFDSSNFDSPNFDSSNFDSSNSDSPNFDSSSGVLEIGPGFGALTDYLIESSQSYIGIEYDKKIFAWLNERYKSESQPKTQQKSQQKSQQKGHQKSVNFFHLDAMKLPERLDAMKLSDGGKNYEFDSKFNFNYLVANLPYNIAIPLLISYFRYFPQLKKAIVLVQKEAADRILAKKNEANYSIPSVKLDLLTHRKKLLAVPPSVFWPR